MKIHFFKPFLVLFFLSFHAFVAVGGTGDDFFNESRSQDGAVRSEYSTAQNLWDLMTEVDRAQFLADSKEAFSGDNMLDAMPRIISADEYDHVLKAGVKQRADALRAFLQDHYSGKKSYQRAGIIPKTVIEKIVKRHNEEGFDGKVNPNQISFVYGPDIIRDRHGNFRVIEDNPGWIGGLGDLVLAQDYTLFRFPQLKDDAEFREASEFYRILGKRYSDRARQNGGVAVMYMIPPYPDNEDKRIRQHFADQGIETVTPFSRLQIKTTANGVYLFDSKDSAISHKKVGMIALNGELYWLDPSHAENRKKLLINKAQDGINTFERGTKIYRALQRELKKVPLDKVKIKKLVLNSPYDVSNYRTAKELENSLAAVAETLRIEWTAVRALKVALESHTFNEASIMTELKKLSLSADVKRSLRLAGLANGLTDLHLSGKVAINNSPGIDFIGDKEFYVYVEDLIRFYLRQEPLIRNITTEKFADKQGLLKGSAMTEVFENIHKYVVKKVDGRGGDSVWVGPKTKKIEMESLKIEISKNPDEYIFQKYTALSRLNDNIVDMRVIADVGPQDTFVTDTPWGRGLPKDGSGKVNISIEGREVTVLVHKNKKIKMCNEFFGIGK